MERQKIQADFCDIEVIKEFKNLIPPLADEEKHQLEQNIIEFGGARDPLTVWAKDKKLILLDGHNRFEICNRLNLPFGIYEINLKSFDEASDWIDRNQLGRRNLHPDAFTLILGRRYNRAKKAQGGRADRDFGAVNFTPPKTAEKIAKEHGVTEKTVRNAGKVAEAVEKLKKVDPEIESKVSIGKAPPKAAVVKAAALLENSPDKAKAIIEGHKKMADVIREEKREEIISRLEDVSTKTAKELAGQYDVLVIDPPWPMEKIERNERANQSEFDYPTMSEEELEQLKLPLAENCHVWLWTTHKFFPMALRLLDGWKLKYVCTFVWHKPGGFQPFNLPQFNCEFAIYARHGTPEFIDTKAFPVCFNAPRGKHSEKPEEFYDIVRRVTAGTRMDLFNRRPIKGFYGWGKESKS